MEYIEPSKLMEIPWRKHLPPEREVLGEGDIKAGDAMWFSAGNKWIFVTGADIGDSVLTDGVGGSRIVIRYKKDAAPPGYRQVKHPALIKKGMLVWKNDEWNAKVADAIAGMKSGASANPMIEPAPPNGCDWIEEEELTIPGDLKLEPDSTMPAGFRLIPQSGTCMVPTNYTYIRPTKDKPAWPSELVYVKEQQAPPASSSNPAWGSW